MENIAPPLEVLLELEYSLRSGKSLQASINQVIKTHRSEFRADLESLLQAHLKGEEFQYSGSSIYRRNLTDLMQRGLRGNPILESLSELKKEIEWSAQNEFDGFVSRLPFLAMIPLLGFFFPAYLIILLGPILIQFVEVLQQ